MSIHEFRFLTDENIDKELVEFLRSAGFDVFDIKEEGLFRLSDVAILELSFSQKRIVISQDSDFGTLIFRDGAIFYGVIYLRPGHQSPELHIETIRTIIEANFDFVMPFILVAENTKGLVKMRLRSI